MKIIGGGFTVEKGVEIGAELDTVLAELSKLEDCAKNPTNPLTQKQYQEDPTARDRVLQQIAEARAEMIANTVVMELGVLNGYVAGFGPKWLGYVIGPGTAWSQATLKELNQQRLEEIKRAVTKCDCGPAGVSGGGSTGGGSTGGGTSGGGTSGGGSGGSCEFPFTWSGTVDYEIKLDGKVIFSAHVSQVKWQLNPDSSATTSLYDLVGGTIDWHYDIVDQNGDCLVEYHGAGTERAAPDEPRDFGGEGGAGDVDETAQLSVRWLDLNPSVPVPNYWASAATRLHNKIHFSNSCSGLTGDHNPDKLDPTLTKWLNMPSDPFQVITADRMSGTWTLSGTTRSATWTWDFAPN